MNTRVSGLKDSHGMLRSVSKASKNADLLQSRQLCDQAAYLHKKKL